MSGPLQMYVYVHDAILRGVAGYEYRAKHLDRDDADAVADFAGELHWFHEMVKAHEKAEEAVLFPALNDRFAFVAETYAYDHDDFEPHVFAGLDESLAGLQRASGSGERTEMAELLYRQSVALHEHMRLHISKENELLLPKLEAAFDVDEQVYIAAAMAGRFEPPLMGALVSWMFAGQSEEDREGMIRFLMSALPPPAFAGLSQVLAARNTTDWAQIRLRVPEVEGSTS